MSALITMCFIYRLGCGTGEQNGFCTKKPSDQVLHRVDFTIMGDKKKYFPCPLSSF
ncbi:hypothetical protein XELAEV_18038785mg [Xenopus laevis]|uniref:Uncharacterized protein n=1 Tax=Xenopus laevis TaxID=8355 RepID=A0A974H798_XENLA|nr:hypothetical protein XELAEV_18038785mg [Xenopus laevis]